MDLIDVDGVKFEAFKLATAQSNILLIKTTKGFLGCGYFSVETADKLKEPVAIVTGVKTYEDMLSAKVVRVSETARTLGLTEGISGREAISLLR